MMNDSDKNIWASMKHEPCGDVASDCDECLRERCGELVHEALIQRVGYPSSLLEAASRVLLQGWYDRIVEREKLDEKQAKRFRDALEDESGWEVAS